MKAKRMVALVAGAALAAGMAVGMTACKKDSDGENRKYESLGTTTLNIGDYAREFEFDSSSKPKQGYKSAETLLTIAAGQKVSNFGTNYGELIAYETDDAKYNVYNLLLGKDVLTALETVPHTVCLNYAGGYSLYVNRIYVISVADTTDAGKVTYYMTDGSELFAKDEYVNITARTSQAYVGTDKETSSILSITAVNSTGDSVDKYFKVELYEGNGDVLSYEPVNDSDIKFFSPEYSKGEEVLYYYEYEKLHLYTPSSMIKEEQVEGEMKDYTVKRDGGYNYTFYKNGEKTGTVNLMNKVWLGCIENNFYYYSHDAVDSTATEGFNFVEMTEAGNELKYNYQLYKYDIIENTTTELNYDVVVLEMYSLYNYTEKAYDAAYVIGLKMINGVAYFRDYSECIPQDIATYITDKDFNVAYDVSGYDLRCNVNGGYDETPEISKVNDNTYLFNVGNTNNPYYIAFDENLKPKNWHFSAVNGNPYDENDNLYFEEGLIQITSEPGYSRYYGFTDLTGKVVIEPKYLGGNSDSIVFYDGIAYVKEKTLSGDKELLLKKDGTVVAEIEELEKSTSEYVTKEVEVKNGYYTLTTTTEDETTGDITVTKDFYTFDGTLIKSFSGYYDIEVSSLVPRQNTLGITVRKTDDTLGPVYEYYKLVK